MKDALGKDQALALGKDQALSNSHIFALENKAILDRVILQPGCADTLRAPLSLPTGFDHGGTVTC
jgi:hypothetical protein